MGRWEVRAGRRAGPPKAVQGSDPSPTRGPDHRHPSLPQCAYLQAQNCRVESKYLAGLRRLQEALGVEAGECSELLRQLIQEALQWEASEASAESVVLGPSAVR